MDLATLIGFLVAVGVVGMAVMQGGDIGVIVNGPSLLIVFAGSAGIVLMKFSVGQFCGALKIAMKAFLYKQEKISDLIEKIYEIADAARKNGMLALESIEINHIFLKQSVQYLIDGLDPEVMEHSMENELTQTLERHAMGQQIFKAIGDVGPAMGMIGTLIGLVQMLSNMSDPKTLGPAMAVAMLTTLYGAVLANMVAFPIADKLDLRSKQEKIIMSMTIDAIMAIQEGQNPRTIKDTLFTYLPKKDRKSKDEAAGGGDSAEASA